MKTQIDGAPAFAHLQVVLEPGESIMAESDAMASMAADLEIGRHWFHRPGKVHRWAPHYDIPKRRQAEITAQCEMITTRELVAIAGNAIEAGTAGFERGQ